MHGQLLVPTVHRVAATDAGAFPFLPSSRGLSEAAGAGGTAVFSGA